MKSVRNPSLPEVAVSRVGGDVAVDFFNTVDWRLDPERRSERLRTYLHLLAWMERCELLGGPEVEALQRRAQEQPDLASAEHRRVIDMREAAYEALNGGGYPHALQGHLALAHASSRLERKPDGGWSWVPAALDLATPRHLLAQAFARLMTSPSLARLGRCADPHCGWVFLDTSRQRNRRWCSSADCGNRNRVRAHYRRSKAGPAREAD